MRKNKNTKNYPVGGITFAGSTLNISLNRKGLNTSGLIRLTSALVSMGLHRLDLPNQSIDSFKGLDDISHLNFVFMDFCENSVQNFDFFGSHSSLVEIDLRNNLIQSFFGLTKQSALETVRISGNPIADHPLYRIMLLQTVGYTLRMIDNKVVTPIEVSLARRLGPECALAISCGWMLDLVPRSRHEYNSIIRNLCAAHQNEVHIEPSKSVYSALKNISSNTRESSCIIRKQSQVDCKGHSSATSRGTIVALASQVEFDDGISVSTNLHHENSVLGTLRFYGSSLTLLDFLRSRTIVELDIRRTKLSVTDKLITFSSAYGVEVYAAFQKLTVLEAVCETFNARQNSNLQRLWGGVHEVTTEEPPLPAPVLALAEKPSSSPTLSRKPSCISKSTKRSDSRSAMLASPKNEEVYKTDSTAVPSVKQSHSTDAGGGGSSHVIASQLAPSEGSVRSSVQSYGTTMRGVEIPDNINIPGVPERNIDDMIEPADSSNNRETTSDAIEDRDQDRRETLTAGANDGAVSTPPPEPIQRTAASKFQAFMVDTDSDYLILPIPYSQMDINATYKDAHGMVEEAINTEISLSSQSLRSYPGAAGLIQSSPESLCSQDTTFTTPGVLPLGTVGWPDPLRALLSKAQTYSLAGIFSPLFRAWFTVDSKLLLWDYRTTAECVTCECPDIVVAVGSPVVPHRGIFQPHISYLLPIATSTSVILVGVSVSEARAREVRLFHLGYGVQTSTVITCIRIHDPSRRIFCGGADGSVLELCYRKDNSPLVAHIRLVPYSFLFSSTPVLGHVSAALRSLSSLWGSERPAIRDIVAASKDDILISLDTQNNLTTWIVAENGLHQGAALPHRQGGRNGASDPTSNPLVRIFIIEPDQEDCNLVAIALNGEQFRYRYAVSGGSADISFRTHIQSLVPTDREVSVCGAAGDVVLFSHTAKGGSGGNDQVVLYHSGRYSIQPHNQVRDVATVMEGSTLLGKLEGVEPITETEGQRTDALCRQVLQGPRLFLCSHHHGLALYMRCRPIDTLRMILQSDPKYRDSLLKRFSASFSQTDYCTMLLQLAMDAAHVSNEDYKSFRGSALACYQGINQGSASLNVLGCHLQQSVSPEVQRLCRYLLRQAAVPEIKETPLAYGQKCVAVTVSPFATAVIAVAARSLLPAWSTPLEKLSLTDSERIHKVLSRLAIFLETVDVGPQGPTYFQVPYPAQWKGNRIVLTLPESGSITLTDANKLQMISLHCCYDLIGHAVQAIALLRHWGAVPLMAADNAIILSHLLHDREKALQIGERMARHVLRLGGPAGDSDGLKSITLLKKDCPYFFSSVDISECQATHELRALSSCGSMGLVTASRCTEWASKIAPSAAAYWDSGSLLSLCHELCCLKRDDLAIKLLLHAAYQLDPDKRAQALYAVERCGQPVREVADARTRTVYQKKMKVLEHVVQCLESAWSRNREVLDVLLGGPKRSGSIWGYEVRDEMAHFFLFEWLSCPREDPHTQEMLKQALIAAESPHLEKYLSMNPGQLGEVYTHYLRSAQQNYQAAIEEGVSLAQSDLSHIPRPERINYRIRCISEAVDSARECGSDQAQLLDKRRSLLIAQQHLAKVIEIFCTSELYNPSRTWQVDGRLVTEESLVQSHKEVVQDKVLSATEILRIAGMYGQFGGSEIQLDVLLCADVHDPSTYALCVAHAYEFRGGTGEETARRLLKKYYTPSLNFPLTFVIKRLEAEEYVRCPQGSSRTVELLLECGVDARVVYQAYRSIVDRTDSMTIACPQYDGKVPQAFMLYSLAISVLRLQRLARHNHVPQLDTTAKAVEDLRNRVRSLSACHQSVSKLKHFKRRYFGLCVHAMRGAEREMKFTVNRGKQRDIYLPLPILFDTNSSPGNLHTTHLTAAGKKVFHTLFSLFDSMQKNNQVRDRSHGEATRFVYPNHWFPGVPDETIPLSSSTRWSVKDEIVSGMRGVREVAWTIGFLFTLYLIARKLFEEEINNNVSVDVTHFEKPNPFQGISYRRTFFVVVVMNSSSVKTLRAQLKRKRGEVTSFLDGCFYNSCRRVLKHAMSLDREKYFYGNPSHLPEYKQLVSHPMYWKLIEKNLDAYCYMSSANFVADMRLVIDNCYTFNTRDSPVSECARRIEIQMEDQFVTELGEAPPAVNDIYALGQSKLTTEISSEIWKTVCFYEEMSGSSATEKVTIRPSKYSCACKRRILEILRRSKDASRQSSSVAQMNRTRVAEPKKSNAAAPPPPKVVERLDAVPQNARSDFTMPVLSPVNLPDDPLSEEDEHLLFSGSLVQRSLEVQLFNSFLQCKSQALPYPILFFFCDCFPLTIFLFTIVITAQSRHSCMPGDPGVVIPPPLFVPSVAPLPAEQPKPGQETDKRNHDGAQTTAIEGGIEKDEAKADREARRPRQVPVYPSLAALLQPQLIRLGGDDQRVPHCLDPPEELAMSSCTSLPVPKGPAYIAFGGARYPNTGGLMGGGPEKKRCQQTASKNVDKTRRKEQKRAQREEFVEDQLDIAETYLKMGRQVPRTIDPSETLSLNSSTQNCTDCISTDIKLSNWWTLAYFGSPRQLQLCLDKYGVDTLIDSVGYVNLRRRLWGLKKNGATYSLGYGQKATALQFAAVARRMDNVLLLLSHQARDSRPLLRRILSESVYSQICEAYLSLAGASEPIADTTDDGPLELENNLEPPDKPLTAGLNAAPGVLPFEGFYPAPAPMPAGALPVGTTVAAPMPAGALPAGTTVAAPMPAGALPVGTTVAAPMPAGALPVGTTVAAPMPAGALPVGTTVAAPMPAGALPAGTTVAAPMPAGALPVGTTVAAPMPAGALPAGTTVAAPMPAGALPVGTTVAAPMPAGALPVGTTVAAPMPAGALPAGTTVAAPMPAGALPVGTTVAAPMPAGALPAGTTVAAPMPAGALPVGTTVAAPMPAGALPVGTTVAAPMPAGALPVGTTVAAPMPAGALPVGTTVAAPMPAGALPVGTTVAAPMPAGALPVGTTVAAPMPAGALPVGTTVAAPMPAGALPAGTTVAAPMPAGALPVGTAVTPPVLKSTSEVFPSLHLYGFIGEGERGKKQLRPVGIRKYVYLRINDYIFYLSLCRYASSMPTIFKNVARHDEDLMGELPGKGWRKILSINGALGHELLSLAEELHPKDWEKRFNGALPSLLHMAERQVEGEYHVLVETADGVQEEVAVPFCSPEVIDAIKKNFEGILAVGKAAGISEKDLAATFAGTLIHYRSETENDGPGMGMGMDPTMEDLQNMAGNLPDTIYTFYAYPNYLVAPLNTQVCNETVHITNVCFIFRRPLFIHRSSLFFFFFFVLLQWHLFPFRGIEQLLVGMEALHQRCSFASELQAGENDATLDMDVLQGLLVTRGKAKLHATGSFISLVVKESAQTEVGLLPCGARSLLLSSDTGIAHIQARGVNKFLDFSEVGDDWRRDPQLWGTCSVSIQRKMAGFSVCLFTLDGNSLNVMSKHVVDGPHAHLARQLLEKVLSSQQQHQMAQDLFALGATAACECIATDVDFAHPVWENPRFNNSLVLFSVQRNCVPELSLCWKSMQQYAASWGIPCAPHISEVTQEQLEDTIVSTRRHWEAALLFDGTSAAEGLAEGIVIVIALPSSSAEGTHSFWGRQIRLKVKTVQYTVLRSLRSLILAESRYRAFSIHVAVLQWAAKLSIQLEAFIRSHGVYVLWRKFEEYVSSRARLSFRDAPYSVGEAYQHALRVSERECCLSERAQVTLVLLCGLPGAGKSTLASHLVSLCSDSGRFGAVVCISRDGISHALENDLRRDQNSLSKHQLRKIKGHVHSRMVSCLRGAAQLSAHCGPVVVVLDACNSTPEARLVWRRTLPPHIDGYHVAHIECSEEEALLQRLATRPGHECLSGAENAQRALFTVRRKFVRPALGADGVVPVELDSAVTPARDMALQLFQHVSARSGEALTCENGAAPVVTWNKMSMELAQRFLPVLRSLFNVDKPNSEVMELMKASGTIARPRLSAVVLRLHTSWDALESLAARTLLPFVRERSVGVPRGLFARMWEAATRWRRVREDTVVAGQSRWLAGWCTDSNRVGISSAAALVAALRSRFPQRPHQPHVTLYCSPSSNSNYSVSDVMSAFTRMSGLQDAQPLPVVLTDLLIDRHALCFAAAIGPDIATHQWTEANGQGAPLHVTLGCSDGVPFAYAGEMFREFMLREASNNELLAAQRCSVATRSRQKYHNFTRIQLGRGKRECGTVELSNYLGTNAKTCLCFSSIAFLFLLSINCPSKNKNYNAAPRRTHGAVPASMESSGKDTGRLSEVEAYMEFVTDHFSKELIAFYEVDGSETAVQHLRGCISAGAEVWGHPMRVPCPPFFMDPMLFRKISDGIQPAITTTSILPTVLFGVPIPAYRWAAKVLPNSFLCMANKHREELYQIVTLLENDPRILMEVVNNLHPESRRRLVVAGGAMEWFGAESAAQEIERADVDKDREISPKDFDHWFENALKRKLDQQKTVKLKDPALVESSSSPPFRTLVLIAVEAGLPFVGFGFLDNAAMILAGDAIDGTLGFYLNCSVLASAAMGNVCSGLLGMQVHGLIERSVGRLCHFHPVLTEEHMRHPSVFYAGHVGGTLGILIGLLLGMLPLLFIDTDPNEKADYAIFQKLDHNSSGSIELPEFVKCLEALGLRDCHSRANHLLEKYGDGKELNFEQFGRLRLERNAAIHSTVQISRKVENVRSADEKYFNAGCRHPRWISEACQLEALLRFIRKFRSAPHASMIYTSLCHTITEVCRAAAVPLSVEEISMIFGGVVEEKWVDMACRSLCGEGTLVRCSCRTYTLRILQDDFMANALISSEYQALGMTLLEVEKDVHVRYIPSSFEHRFLEVGASTIGPGAGAGLFVRRGRRIPAGCVFCEYRGRQLPVGDGAYVVRVRQTGTFIDGVAEDGSHLSLATLINDNGPMNMNAGMMEYQRFVGRVFLVAARDLQPGEEVFVLYGAKYWGFPSYESLGKALRRAAVRRRHGGTHNNTCALLPTPTEMMKCCKSCGAAVLPRTVGLHAPACGDPLAARKLLHLDCMPRSAFTAFSAVDQVIPSRRHRGHFVSRFMVKDTNPQTLTHTHADAVGDKVYIFHSVDDNTTNEKERTRTVSLCGLGAADRGGNDCGCNASPTSQLFLSTPPRQSLLRCFNTALAGRRIATESDSYNSAILKAVHFDPCRVSAVGASLIFPWTATRASLNGFNSVHGGTMATLAESFTRMHMLASSESDNATTDAAATRAGGVPTVIRRRFHFPKRGDSGRTGCGVALHVCPAAGGAELAIHSSPPFRTRKPAKRIESPVAPVTARLIHLFAQPYDRVCPRHHQTEFLPIHLQETIFLDFVKTASCLPSSLRFSCVSAKIVLWPFIASRLYILLFLFYFFRFRVLLVVTPSFFTVISLEVQHTQDSHYIYIYIYIYITPFGIIFHLFILYISNSLEGFGARFFLGVVLVIYIPGARPPILKRICILHFSVAHATAFIRSFVVTVPLSFVLFPVSYERCSHNKGIQDPMAVRPPLQRKRGCSFVVDYQRKPLKQLLAEDAAAAADTSPEIPAAEDISTTQRRLLPPQSPHLRERLTVVLDLDETLVYARAGPLYVRPGIEQLLAFLREHCETIVWTSGVNRYAEAVVSEIDKHCVVSHTISRDARWVRDGAKDVKLLNRDLDRLILIDNTPDSLRGNELNGLLVEDYEGGELEDGTLHSLVELLADLKDQLERGVTVPQYIRSSPRVMHRSLPTDAGEMMRCPCLVTDLPLTDLMMQILKVQRQTNERRKKNNMRNANDEKKKKKKRCVRSYIRRDFSSLVSELYSNNTHDGGPTDVQKDVLLPPIKPSTNLKEYMSCIYIYIFFFNGILLVLYLQVRTALPPPHRLASCERFTSGPYFTPHLLDLPGRTVPPTRLQEKRLPVTGDKERNTNEVLELRRCAFRTSSAAYVLAVQGPRLFLFLFNGFLGPKRSAREKSNCKAENGGCIVSHHWLVVPHVEADTVKEGSRQTLALRGDAGKGSQSFEQSSPSDSPEKLPQHALFISTVIHSICYGSLNTDPYRRVYLHIRIFLYMILYNSGYSTPPLYIYLYIYPCIYLLYIYMLKRPCTSLYAGYLCSISRLRPRTLFPLELLYPLRFSPRPSNPDPDIIRIFSSRLDVTRPFRDPQPGAPLHARSEIYIYFVSPGITRDVRFRVPVTMYLHFAAHISLFGYLL
eukprot:gene6621-4741_t